MWKVLPAENRQGIKNFIIAFIIKTSSDEVSLERNRTLLGKLNIVLVQVMQGLILDFEAGLASKLAFVYPRNSSLK
jgi:hypothetical protein